MSWITKSFFYSLSIIAILLVFMHYLPNYFTVDVGNYLTIIGFFFLGVSAILLYFQIRTGLAFNKRKAAFDFISKNIPDELIPMYRRLTEITGAPTVTKMFEEYNVIKINSSDEYTAEQKKEFGNTLLGVLNFYERMAIGIYKQVLENDICYDDIGNNLIKLYPWVKQYIANLQSSHNEERLFVNLETLATHWTRVHAERKQKNVQENLRLKQRQTIVNKNI